MPTWLMTGTPASAIALITGTFSSPAFLRSARSGTVSFLRSSGTEGGLVGPLVERFHLPPHRVGVRRERRLVDIRVRAWLGVEVMIAVDAAHEHRRVAHLGLAHVS